MIFDSIDIKAISLPEINISEKLSQIGEVFSEGIDTAQETYRSVSETTVGKVSTWVGDNKVAVENLSVESAFSSIKQMYQGIDLGDGNFSLSLKEISEWKINPEYATQNLKQHAGYAAEVISTAKENIISEAEGNGIKTFRADDLTDIFKRNDQYVDKVRVDINTGEILETIQTKFVGNDAASCLQKLVSKDFDKYFSDKGPDKIEIPKDYYDGVKSLIAEKIDDLNEQLDRVTAEGKTDVAEKIKAKIERYKQVDEKVEQSTVTSDEARYAVEHPDRYAQKLFMEETVIKANKAGVKTGLTAAALTACVSIVDNVKLYTAGEITAKEAFIDVAKDAGTAGAIGYGTAFISTSVTSVMSQSSYELIKSISNTGLPAATISFAVSSYDSVHDFSQGVIDGKQLAYDLGENASKVAGSMAGSMAAGAAVGSIIPGAGTIVGAGLGIAGGMIGCAIASEAYRTAVELGAENVTELKNAMQESVDSTLNAVREYAPDKIESVKTSIREYANKNNLPINI